MTISSQLVAAMGGQFWVESELGLGSTFHFTARFGIAPDVPQEEEANEALRGLEALVVDDNATNRRILDEVLRGWACIPCWPEAERKLSRW